MNKRFTEKWKFHSMWKSQLSNTSKSQTQFRYFSEFVELSWSLLCSRVPLLFESVKQYGVVVPKIVPKYNDIYVPIYLPRFVEATRSDEVDLPGMHRVGITIDNLPPCWNEPFYQQAMCSLNKVGLYRPSLSDGPHTATPPSSPQHVGRLNEAYLKIPSLAGSVSVVSTTIPKGSCPDSEWHLC